MVANLLIIEDGTWWWCCDVHWCIQKFPNRERLNGRINNYQRIEILSKYKCGERSDILVKFWVFSIKFEKLWQKTWNSNYYLAIALFTKVTLPKLYAHQEISWWASPPLPLVKLSLSLNLGQRWIPNSKNMKKSVSKICV